MTATTASARRPIRARAAGRLRRTAEGTLAALAAASVIAVPGEDGTEDVWPLWPPFVC